MTADHASSAPEAPQFLVRPDGSVTGDDGAAGTLAAALPYAGRLARRAGELVGVGDLRLLEAFGREHLIVGVTWTPAGEGTFRAVVAPLAPRTVPTFTVVGAVDPAAAVSHCLSRFAGLAGVAWGSVVTADARVVGVVGQAQDLDRLAEAGNRMLAILRSLEDRHTTGFVRLRCEDGALVGASLGRHALVAAVTSADDAALVATIDEIRAILADQDLSALPSHHDAPAEGPVTPAPAAGPPAPLVGARFGGATPASRKGRRSRFSR